MDDVDRISSIDSTAINNHDDNNNNKALIILKEDMDK